MNYTEYMVMLSYKTEENLLEKKVNQPYRINRDGADEKPQRHRRARFWWHHDPQKIEEK